MIYQLMRSGLELAVMTLVGLLFAFKKWPGQGVAKVRAGALWGGCLKGRVEKGGARAGDYRVPAGRLGCDAVRRGGYIS